MILYAAIGDAYGAGFEFASREKIEGQNTVSQYERHPLYERIYKRYTDDTQMAIAIAELMLSNKEWTAENVAQYFVAVFKRDVREGYAKRFYQLLTEIESGAELLERIVPKSVRNGAAMRAYPLGLLKEEAEILEKCRIQAMVTHHTQPAILAAQAVALISHYYCYQKGEKAHLLTYLADIQDYRWQGNWVGEVKTDAIQTVEAVLTVLLQENSLKTMLQKSVAFGGDVDTVASLALAIAYWDNAVERDLPSFLYNELENGAYGRDYIDGLDRDLREAFLNGNG